MPRKTKRTSDALERRFTIRTSDDDFAAWEARARELGYVGAAPWVRRVANDAIAAAKQAELPSSYEAKRTELMSKAMSKENG